MRLTPHEQERLLLSYATDLALRRKERGIRLNPALRFDRDKARPA